MEQNSMTHSSNRETDKWLAELASLQTLLDGFLTLLQNEKDAIKHSQIEQLSQIISDKSEASFELENRMTQLNQLAKARFDQTFTDLLAQSDNLTNLEPDERQALQETQQLTLKCHDLNQANGIAIQILKNMNEFTLSLVSGNDPDFKTYGSKGQKHRSRSGQTLGKA